MKSRVGLIGIPFDRNSSYLRGTALAPPLIREAFYSQASNSFTEFGIDLSKDHVVDDRGDLKDPEFEEIEPAIGRLLEDGLSPLSLGGDHSITHPILRAFHNHFPELVILHFDAHPDLYHDFEGNPRSHASPFARIMEERLAQRLVQVGIRTINTHQREQAEKFGVEIHEMRNWNPARIFEFQQPVYISFDMDALDPAFAPGVSHREAGGFTTREALHVIQSLRARVVGADVVEFNPALDPSGITAPCCAKLVKEIASKILEA
jgi:arginase